jgi:hypothetical protein
MAQTRSPQPSPPVPDFFLVGAFKSGTTSLYRYLGQHPDVYLSPKKEPGFFASELRIERMNPAWRTRIEADARAFARYLDRPHRRGPPPRGRVTTCEDYLELFRSAKPGQAIGEGSVGYLWSRTAARVRERIPAARILMILRNPCDRAFSQYKSLPTSTVSPSFGEAIRRAAARRAAARALRRPASSLKMTQDDRRFLIDYYTEDVRRLESLIDRDLSTWLE